MEAHLFSEFFGTSVRVIEIILWELIIWGSLCPKVGHPISFGLFIL
jgi:hypothetical protein